MILEQLAQHARERVLADQEQISLSEMKDKAFSQEKGDFPFEKALLRGKQEQGIAIIAEVKKASPSKGVISPEFPYLQIAQDYQGAGCHAISVLTEPKWFLGSDAIFQQVRQAVTCPMIRKDFTVDPYQIYQAKSMGADAVLLICAILPPDTVKEYLSLCDTLGLSALVETHDAQELAIAEDLGARIIGVNNRNLKDFTVNTDNASQLRKKLSTPAIFVAESGIVTSEDGVKLGKEGADALLIGEALMRTADKAGFMKGIFQGCTP